MAEFGVPVVGIFPLGVGVMNDQAETVRRRSASSIAAFQIAVRIAERGDRPAADMLLDADRLAGLVVDEVDLRQPKQVRRAVLHLELRLDRRPHHLLRRNAVDLFVQGRMNSMPPPDTMKVLKPLARR